MNIQESLHAVARRHPDRPAIESISSVWSYRQVHAASRACAGHLRALQAQSGFKTAAILANRSPSLPIQVLACLQAGIPFAILDSAYPDAHLGRMLDILPEPLLLEPESRGDGTGQRLHDSRCQRASIKVDSLKAIVPPPQTLDSPPLAALSVAYYLFTSGSTGVPKCIETPAEPLGHFLDWYAHTFPSRPGTRYAMLSGLSHDPIFRDMLVPLTTGGLLYIPEQGMLLQPRLLYRWLQEHRIARLHTTPPMLEVLGAGGDPTQPLLDLQHVFSGGDMLQAAQVAQLRQLAPACQVVNFYGTSETPQAVAWYLVRQGEPDPIPVGRGIDDVDLLVLDEQLKPAAQGMPGQLAVRSAYLSKGYKDDDEASRRQYLELGPADGRTTYLTGDLGYVSAHGDVVLTGRADDQINLHGYRIELDAINVALRGLLQGSSAVVLPVKLADGESKLCAYLVYRGSDRFSEEQRIKQQLTALLPHYMLPGLWEWVDEIPLLPNGKVDRQQLINGTRERLKSQVSASDATGTLCQAMQAILGVPVTPADSFVGLGGDSLSFIRASILIEDRLGHLPAGWERMSIGELISSGRPSLEQAESTWTSRLTTVESTLLLRVISIFLVTLSHTGSNAIVLMATSTLFIVSGMSFGRFLRPVIQDSGRLAPTLHFIAKFGILAALWQTLRSLYYQRLWIPDLILLGTFFQKPGDAHFTFWYLDVLAFNVLVLALSDKASWLWRRSNNEVLRADTFRSDLSLLAIGLGMAFVQVHYDIWNGTVGQASVAPFKWFWMLALGLVITQARTPTRRFGMTLFILGLGVANLSDLSMTVRQIFEYQVTEFFLVTTLLLIWVDRFPVPRFLRPILVEIGSATLTIYIVNHAVINLLMPGLGLPDWLWLQVALALATGIMANRAWGKVSRFLKIG